MHFYQRPSHNQYRCPVKFSFDDFKIKEPNFQQIELLFKELEFNNILNRVKKVFNLSNDDDEHQVKSKIGLQTDLFSQLEDENIKESGSIKYFKMRLILNQ